MWSLTIFWVYKTLSYSVLKCKKKTEYPNPQHGYAYFNQAREEREMDIAREIQGLEEENQHLR